MIRATCPTSTEHRRFATTAHVVQEWEVDENGEFQAVIRDLQTAHWPRPDNHWTCRTCGAAATVEETP